jgi:epsilon-lactone hydrolase
MPSVKARAMVLMLRGMRKAFYRENMSVLQLRKGFEVLMARFPMPAGVSMQKKTELGLRGWSIQPETIKHSGCILFLHGGAYAMGSGRTHAAWVALLAQKSGCRVFMPEYPLSPEHPYPSAFNLLSHWLPTWSASLNHRFVLAGDSAGGGLALALHHNLLHKKLPAGLALVLFSPWVDLRPLPPAALKLASKDAYIQAQDVERFAELYAKNQRWNPEVSPLLHAKKTQSPVWLHYSSDELLSIQCQHLGSILRGSGIQVEEQAWPGLFHVFQAAGTWLPESESSLLSAAAFAEQAFLKG